MLHKSKQQMSLKYLWLDKKLHKLKKKTKQTKYLFIIIIIIMMIIIMDLSILLREDFAIKYYYNYWWTFD